MARDRLDYPNQINWQNLANGIEFYKHHFSYLEVPWLAPTKILEITYPYEYRMKTELGDPVASGEQSFLHLQFNQGLVPGKYMTITPCFRDEEETEFNFLQFMKLELYITEDVNQNTLESFVIPLCQSFLSGQLSHPVDILATGDGSYDLTCNNIELGSYGIREYNGHRWIYATGIAEPRLSQVAGLIGNK